MHKNRTRKFFSYYKPYRRLFAAVMACAAVDTAAALVFPLLVRRITEDIVASGMANALSQIYMTAGGMVALLAVQAVCAWFFDGYGHAMGASMERDIRAELFAQFQRLSFSYYDDQKVGQLMARISKDPETLTELYHHLPENAVIYGVKAAGALAILLCTNLSLALIVAAFLPVMVVYTLYFNKGLQAAYKTNLEVIGDVNARVEDSLGGIRVVKSFANESIENERFGKQNNRFLAGRKRIYRTEAYYYTGLDLLSKLITVAVVVFGGAAIVGARLELPGLITFLLYVGYLVEPIPKLAFMVRQYREGVTGFNRIMDILEMQPDIADARDAVELGNVRGEVTLADVSFRYKAHLPDVLSGVSFSAKPGETVALVGYSGVGKTTLCSLIPRFYEATGGSVRIDGMDVRAYTLRSLRRAIGVVQQDVYLFSGTVRENILYGKPDATMDEVVAAAKKANAHGFIQDLPNGYDTDIGQRGIKLSGGQKQRISIARVFLKDPPILILDEATSALDSESERVVQSSLEALSENRTTFVIAHRLSTVRRAKRILVLSDDGIAEEGTHEELMRKAGVYAGLYLGAE